MKKGVKIGIIIGIILLIAIIVCLVVFIPKSNEKSSEEKLSLENNVEEEKNETGFYAVDFDYASLEENEAPNSKFAYGKYLQDYYGLDEIPDKLFEEQEVDIYKEMEEGEYKEPNSVSSYPFIESLASYDCRVYNLDGQTSITDAYNKGWYVIVDLDIVNYSGDFDLTNQYDSFDAIIYDLGKPYCAIHNEDLELSDDGWKYNTIVLIYKYNDNYIILAYYDNKNSITGEEKLGKTEAYFTPSEDMMKAFVNDFCNKIDKAERTTYLFQNGKNVLFDETLNKK